MIIFFNADLLTGHKEPGNDFTLNEFTIDMFLRHGTEDMLDEFQHLFTNNRFLCFKTQKNNKNKQTNKNKQFINVCAYQTFKNRRFLN